MIKIKRRNKQKKLKLTFTMKELEALSLWLVYGDLTFKLNEARTGKMVAPKSAVNSIIKIRKNIFKQIHEQKICNGKKYSCKSKLCPYNKKDEKKGTKK